MTPVVAKFFEVSPRSLQRQYKNYLSDFKAWDQKGHAKEWLTFPENIGAHLSIDETALSQGELSNKKKIMSYFVVCM